MVEVILEGSYPSNLKFQDWYNYQGYLELHQTTYFQINPIHSDLLNSQSTVAATRTNYFGINLVKLTGGG